MSRFRPSLGAKPTCQILPPDFPGYRRYCPYTINPSPKRDGVWKGPDLERARRLIAASGTRGAPVTIWIPGNQRSEGPIAAELMRSLGYRAHAKDVSIPLFFSDKGLRNPRSRVQAGVSSWFADYQGASSFIIDVFSCKGFAHFCDPRLEALIRRARTLTITDPYAANQLWARIDHAMVDRAAVVPLITHKTLELVSKRVKNFESSPSFVGVLLDQLWVK